MRGNGERKKETEKHRERKRERSVPIKTKSIKRRKQFRLAQVERKLEKSLANCALTHTNTQVYLCARTNTVRVISVRLTGNWTVRK